MNLDWLCFMINHPISCYYGMKKSKWEITVNNDEGHIQALVTLDVKEDRRLIAQFSFAYYKFLS